MTRRVLRDNRAPNTDHISLATDLGSGEAQKNLATTTSELWKAGSHVKFWLFHRSQESIKTWLNLPPYQFEKTRHWIQYKSSVDPSTSTAESNPQPQEPELIQLQSGSDPQGLEFFFAIDPTHPTFSLCTQGHAVLNQSLCPASMYVELVVRAAKLIGGSAPSFNPQVENLEISSPLGINPPHNIFLRLDKTALRDSTWAFTLYSSNQGAAGVPTTVFAKGSVSLLASKAHHLRPISRLISKSRCDQIRNSRSATGLLGSALVYKAFSSVVNYADYYRGVQNVFAQGNEAVGLVLVPEGQPGALEPGVCDPVVMDNFLQVSGIHVNCLSERKDEEVFMCTSIGVVSFTETFLQKQSGERFGERDHSD